MTSRSCTKTLLGPHIGSLMLPDFFLLLFSDESL